MSLFGALILGQGLWILAVNPDPPAGARTATRRSRQITAIGLIILAVFAIAFNASSIFSGAK
jgi:hypothetical protein